MPPGTYQVGGTLEDSSGNVLIAQSPYTIVKLDASERADMKAWIDSANRAHFFDGNPHYVLGIYDTTGLFEQPLLLHNPAGRDRAGADQHDHQLLHHQRADAGD